LKQNEKAIIKTSRVLSFPSKFGLNNVAILALGATILSFSGIFVALSDMPPTVIGFYRMLIGGLLLAFLFCGGVN